MINFTYLLPTNSFEADEILLRNWLKEIINYEKKIAGDIQYIFCNDDYLYDINVRFLNHDSLTDIITFPTSANTEIISGEIFISIDRVKENSSNMQIQFDSEFMRVLAHGILHLLGYKDKSQSEKKQMRSKEDYYLNLQP
jgi:probable rRNA maturation factor